MFKQLNGQVLKSFKLMRTGPKLEKKKKNENRWAGLKKNGPCRLLPRSVSVHVLRRPKCITMKKTFIIAH